MFTIAAKYFSWIMAGNYKKCARYKMADLRVHEHEPLGSSNDRLKESC